MDKKIILIVAASLLLSGCVTTAQKAEWAQQAAKPVTCREGKDCALKWGIALRWVQAHSIYRLSMVNDSIIATYGPFPNSAKNAFQVTKTPAGGGVYDITLAAGCDNLIGCVPDTGLLKANFVNTMRGADTLLPRKAQKR